MKQLPIVALVGPVNAGKSSLMNRIDGNRIALTSNVAGTTRDRQYTDIKWNRAEFTLLDTAGIVGDLKNELEEKVAEQIKVAIKEADCLVLVVDGKAPVANISKEIISLLRKSKKPVILAVNKTDSVKKIDEKLGEYAFTGIKDAYAVSALNGSNVGDLLDGIVEKIGKITKPDAPEPKGIAVSIVGKPNVGKSSLFNKILGQDRMVVSSVPGTTRNAIDVTMDLDGTTYTFIDTAGLKRKEHRQEQPDIFAGFQTFKSIRRSDVVLLLIDAVEKITKQDQVIAKNILDLEKGLIVVVNKMDIFNGSEEAMQAYVSDHFPQAWISPVFLISAKTGEGISEIFEAIPQIYANRNKVVDQETISAFLTRKLKTTPPKRLMDQKVPRVFGLKQVSSNPPMFELLVNHPAAISPHFRKTIQNGITKELDFWGTPVILKLRGKDKK